MGVGEAVWNEANITCWLSQAQTSAVLQVCGAESAYSRGLLLTGAHGRTSRSTCKENSSPALSTLSHQADFLAQLPWGLEDHLMMAKTEPTLPLALLGS